MPFQAVLALGPERLLLGVSPTGKGGGVPMRGRRWEGEEGGLGRRTRSKEPGKLPPRWAKRRPAGEADRTAASGEGPAFSKPSVHPRPRLREGTRCGLAATELVAAPRALLGSRAQGVVCCAAGPCIPGGSTCRAIASHAAGDSRSPTTWRSPLRGGPSPRLRAAPAPRHDGALVSRRRPSREEGTPCGGGRLRSNKPAARRQRDHNSKITPRTQPDSQTSH